MSFKQGNQYWKIRSKNGRDRIIQDPEKLMESANEYFQWCIDNPVIQIDFRSTKNGLERIEIPHPQVFQKGALARFCGVSEWRLINDLKGVSSDFSQVITYIEGVVRDQKFKYATVNMFNSNIIARDLGLKDRSDQTSDDKEIKPTIINLGSGEITKETE
jgi:hypothetical protein